MKAYIFPGQGAQFPGMARNLFEQSDEGKALFHLANEVLGFDIAQIMFEGTEEELRQTKVTQPAIFLHSCAVVKSLGDQFQPSMVAGHSLGEFSSLVANGTLTFVDGLRLVAARSAAMQRACEAVPGTMAAVLGLDDEVVERICSEIDGVVVPANYNCPGQLVISGAVQAVTEACEKLKLAGAKRALLLTVGGAFHSPLMEPARVDLEKAIASTAFMSPACPVYQNVNAAPSSDPDEIKRNLIAQLTGPVKWTQTIRNMVSDGCSSFTEVGPGKVLQGLVKKINPESEAFSA
jgi:[acyl-carrier-protein] S-malonyltransferase